MSVMNEFANTLFTLHEQHFKNVLICPVFWNSDSLSNLVCSSNLRHLQTSEHENTSHALRKEGNQLSIISYWCTMGDSSVSALGHTGLFSWIFHFPARDSPKLSPPHRYGCCVLNEGRKKQTKKTNANQHQRENKIIQRHLSRVEEKKTIHRSALVPISI